MKKITLLLVILIMSTALVGCGDKEKIAINDFTAIANEYNFYVEDSTDTYGDTNVKEGKVAMLSNACTVEFIEFETEEDAIRMFDSIQPVFASFEEDSRKHVSVDLKHYDKYMVSTDMYYKYVSRVDNTLVYVNTISSHEKEVKEFIDRMGY